MASQLMVNPPISRMHACTGRSPQEPIWQSCFGNKTRNCENSQLKGTLWLSGSECLGRDHEALQVREFLKVHSSWTSCDPQGLRSTCVPGFEFHSFRPVKVRGPEALTYTSLFMELLTASDHALPHNSSPLTRCHP